MRSVPCRTNLLFIDTPSPCQAAEIERAAMGGCSLLYRCKLSIPASGIDFLQRFMLSFIKGKTRVRHEVLIVAVRTQIGSSIQVMDHANLVCDHFT
jgi:hypothetical protein